MSYVLGLTGSIGMGKSTTAQMFADEGCAVWDADAAVHRLYAKGGAAVEPMRAAFPNAIFDEQVSRQALKEIIEADPAALKAIEGIVHPLVGADRAQFRAETTADIVVVDVPLLFETGGDRHVDGVAVVSVDAATQKARVLARGTMTEAQFESIRAKQMADAIKRDRAHWVIPTHTQEEAREKVKMIVEEIREKLLHA
ncbi:dephospho-CoA kinase [Chachezhania sediminis]|uniref:dephospho-CoA kinase n=1 Tax=Chachezhania sediminis TaxID=2599291 RepID=UPI00131AEC0B|nr:dephospho-CoA kinase [Chachezhania sediminis]